MRFGGGSEYSVSRTEVGAENCLCVSKKPTERKNGSGQSLMVVSAVGATSPAPLVSSSITSS